MRRTAYQTADAKCLNCGTLHTGLPVSQDEDGRYCAPETIPCGDDECINHLCSDCSQFTCECCSGHFCNEPSHIGIEIEAECTCTFQGDEADATGCDLHGRHPRRSMFVCRTCYQADRETAQPQRVAA